MRVRSKLSRNRRVLMRAVVEGLEPRQLLSVDLLAAHTNVTQQNQSAVPLQLISPLTSPTTAPTVAQPASATPGTVTGTITALSVLGADSSGEQNLTYTWATLGTPPAAVAFSANGSNASKNTTATFIAAGTYNFQVTITNAAQLSVTSNVAV